MITKVKGILFNNLHIKLFALMFAVLLWMHAVTRGESEINFVVPLEIRDIPAGMTVVGEPPPPLDVRIKGNETLIKGLSSRDIGAYISLKDAKEGPSAHVLSANNVKAPYGVSISRVSPFEVNIVLDAEVQKTLGIKPSVAGKPARGHRLGRVEVDPETVVVTGPRHTVERLDGVPTEKLDIGGLTEGFEKAVGLVPPNGTSLESGKARVRVEISRARH